jgi:hypothetical protein
MSKANTEAPKPTLEELVQKEISHPQGVQPDAVQPDQSASDDSDEPPADQVDGGEEDDDDSSSEANEASETSDSQDVDDDEPPADQIEGGKEPDKLSPVGEFLRSEFIRLGFDEAEVNALSEGQLKKEWAARQEEFDREQSQPQQQPQQEIEDEEEPVRKEQASSEEKQQEDGPILKRLQYDQADEKLITWEQIDGLSVAVPKDKASAKGKAAAERINAWAEEWRVRQRKLTEDPLSLLAPDIQKIINAEVQKALSKYEETKVKQYEEQVKQVQEATESDTIRQFFDQHRADLFVLGKDGKPKKSLATRTDILSDRGKQFEEIYMQLSETSTAPRSKLLNKALSMLNKFSPPKAPEPEKTKNEKRRSFLDKGRKNKATPLAASNPPARPDEKARVNGGKKSLADLMLQDADLADNPFVSMLARASS